MLVKELTFSISISFISWIAGMIINGILMKTPYYKHLLNLTIIKSKTLNKRIGLGVFKWIVKNTPFKYFNQKLKLNTKIKNSELEVLRKEMTYSEISHLIGFAFVSVFAIIKIINTQFLFALVITLVNIAMNLYPSLLQQENKKRIDRLMKIIKTISPSN